MSLTLCAGPAILVGYAYRLQIEAEAPLFPEGAEMRAQIRARPSAETVLGEISSAAGGILRLSDHLIELRIGPEITGALSPGSCVLDLVRIDCAPPLHLGFSLELPILTPITRGLT
jgi:hypothetical protein